MEAAAPPGDVLVLDGLVKRFGATVAVDRLSLRVTSGEVFGLIGPDGAGKTTTMRMVAGLMRPDAGAIRALGCAIPGSDGELRRLRARLGYMPQQYSLYGDLTVEENLRFFAGMYGVPAATLRAREKRLLGIARLEEFRDRPASALSGGMYKKLALSCALVHGPELLLLDEPTNGVDPISRRELWAFLEELVAEGVAVLLSTPYMDEAERCDRVGLLVEGTLAAEGSPRALAAAFTETIFELATTRPLQPALLAREPGVREVYTVGKKLHLATGEGPGFLPRIAAAAGAAGAEIVHLAVVEPSFEDIFLGLSRRREAPPSEASAGEDRP